MRALAVHPPESGERAEEEAERGGLAPRVKTVAAFYYYYYYFPLPSSRGCNLTAGFGSAPGISPSG